jgi:spore coat protein A
MITAPQSRKVLTKVLLVLAFGSLLLSAQAWAQLTACTSTPVQPCVQQFVDPLPIPRLGMPPFPTSVITVNGQSIDYYQIAERQFLQPMLSCSEAVLSNGCTARRPMTTVWGYGPASEAASLTATPAAHDPTSCQPGTTCSEFHTPAHTILANTAFPNGHPVRVKWINDLEIGGAFVSYPNPSVPVSTDNHWANPPQLCDHGSMRTDCKGTGGNYYGPVPTVVHLHGGEVNSESDGIPEAWNLPKASTAGFSTAVYFPHGSDYCQVDSSGNRACAYNDDGSALFQYPNTQWPTTLVYHDHSLGVTEQNVYMGLVGAYVLVSLTDSTIDAPRNSAFQAGAFPLVTGSGGLPFGDLHDCQNPPGPASHCYELPLIIADKSFNADGTQLLLRDTGNMIVVNGKTWPYLNVEPRRYRFHIANAASDNVFVLTFGDPGTGPNITQIGADQGFLPKPAGGWPVINRLKLASAERADVIVDFSGFQGRTLTLLNDNGGGATGKVIQFRVGSAVTGGTDTSWSTSAIPALPRRQIPQETYTRRVSLYDNHLGTCDGPPPGCVPNTARPWDADVTETPGATKTELWEMYDFTDSHPMHLHSVSFQVVNRQAISCATPPCPIKLPGPGETGLKDTVLANGGQITRVRIQFNDGFGNPHPGLFAWHCHFTPHEDNEMMRPLCVTAQGSAATAGDGFAGCPTGP